MLPSHKYVAEVDTWQKTVGEMACSSRAMKFEAYFMLVKLVNLFNKDCVYICFTSKWKQLFVFFFFNYLEINRWVCFCGSWCKSCWIEKNYFRGKKKCFKMCLVSGERKQIPEEGKNQNVLEKNCHRQLRFLQTKEKQIHWKQKSEMRSKSSPGRHLTFVK